MLPAPPAFNARVVFVDESAPESTAVTTPATTTAVDAFSSFEDPFEKLVQAATPMQVDDVLIPVAVASVTRRSGPQRLQQQWTVVKTDMEVSLAKLEEKHDRLRAQRLLPSTSATAPPTSTRAIEAGEDEDEGERQRNARIEAMFEQWGEHSASEKEDGDNDDEREGDNAPIMGGRRPDKHEAEYVPNEDDVIAAQVEEHIEGLDLSSDEEGDEHAADAASTSAAAGRRLHPLAASGVRMRPVLLQEEDDDDDDGGQSTSSNENENDGDDVPQFPRDRAVPLGSDDDDDYM